MLSSTSSIGSVFLESILSLSFESINRRIRQLSASTFQLAVAHAEAPKLKDKSISKKVDFNPVVKVLTYYKNPTFKSLAFKPFIEPEIFTQAFEDEVYRVLYAQKKIFLFNEAYVKTLSSALLRILEAPSAQKGTISTVFLDFYMYLENRVDLTYEERQVNQIVREVVITILNDSVVIIFHKILNQNKISRSAAEAALAVD